METEKTESPLECEYVELYTYHVVMRNRDDTTYDHVIIADDVNGIVRGIAKLEFEFDTCIAECRKWISSEMFVMVKDTTTARLRKYMLFSAYDHDLAMGSGYQIESGDSFFLETPIEGFPKTVEPIVDIIDELEEKDYFVFYDSLADIIYQFALKSPVYEQFREEYRDKQHQELEISKKIFNRMLVGDCDEG